MIEKGKTNNIYQYTRITNEFTKTRKCVYNFSLSFVREEVKYKRNIADHRKRKKNNKKREIINTEF